MKSEIIKLNDETKQTFADFIDAMGLNEEGNYLDTYEHVYLYVQNDVPIYYFAINPEGGYIATLIDDDVRNDNYIALLMEIDNVITGGENIEHILSIGTR